MAGEKLDFVSRLGELENIGDSIAIVGESLERMQVARALAYHGKRHGKKFSYVQIDGGYLVVYTANR